MKRALKIAFLASLAFVTLAGATTSALAWFFDGTRLNPTKFYGSSQGAYFAYGTGDEDHPYGINKPRHLYNLAWLNMMGYFEGKGTEGVVYFEIDPSIKNGILDGTTNSGQPTAIPPIGTEEHPFYGNFNGNGKIIKNFVISADVTDYGSQKPYNYTQFFDVNNPPQIVGLFGVVGEINPDTEDPETGDPVPYYSYDSSENEIYNLGLTNLTIKTKAKDSLVGIVAGYVNGAISNVAVNASSIDINEATESSLSEITSNLSDYGVIGHCTSDYIQEENPVDHAKIYEVNTVDLRDPFNAHAKGKQVGAGASIEMMTMYNNLAEIWEECDTNRDTHRAKYTTGTVKAIQSSDGSKEILQAGGTSNAYTYFNAQETAVNNSWSNGYHTYYTASQTYDGKTTAQYSLVVENASNGSNWNPSYSPQNDKKYMCITGKKEIPVLGQTYNTQTYYNYNEPGYSPISSTGYRIYWQEDANTYHFLTYDATGYDSTDEDNASYWALDGSNHLYTITENHIPYYLDCDSNGSLNVTDLVPSSTWSYDSSGHNYTSTVGGTTFYLGFNGTSWTTTVYNSVAETYYLIHSGNNYLTHSGNSAIVLTNSNTVSESRPLSSNVKWYLRTSGNTKYFTTTDGGSYYLSYDSSVRVYSNNNYAMTYNGNTNAGDNTGTIYRSGGWRTYYLRYNNGWSTQTSSTNITVTKVSTIVGYQDSIHCGSVYRSTESSNLQKYNYEYNTLTCQAQTQDTYFPLRRDDDNSSMVDDANTGYVVGGANYTTDKYGDIRVSAFDVSDLSASYTANAGDFSTVYTINGGTTGKTTASQKTVDVSTGAVTGTSRAFTRFSNVKSQMISTLEDDDANGKIYGLHFMDATINTSHTIFAPWVKVRNKSEKDLVGNEVAYSIYEKYEMPEDSIDFHFGENGVITFIAGSYYQASRNDNSTRNNCFFSLHKIERYESVVEASNAGKKVNDIKAIKEIQYVYDNTDSDTKGNYPYVYEYTDGTYSTGTPGSVALFNTDWIRNVGTSSVTLTQNAAYYFEIPAIKGEYALGSVASNGGTTRRGAYLMYLDLGANGNKIARTTVSEHFTVTKDIYDYPIGVGIVSSLTRTNPQTGTIEPYFSANPLDSANLVIKEGFVGTLTINRSSNSVSAVSALHDGYDPPENYDLDDYIGGGYHPMSISLNDGATPTPNPIEGVPKTIVEEEHRRVQLLDYGINYLTLTQTVVDEVTRRTITNYGASTTVNSVSTSIKQYAYDANNNLIAAKTFTTPEQESSIIAYDPTYIDPETGIEDPGAPYNSATIKADIMSLYVNTNTNTIYELYIPHDSTSTIVIDANIIRSSIDAAYHYDVNGYDVLVTVTGTTITVTVASRDESYTFKINGTALNSGSTTISQ